MRHTIRWGLWTIFLASTVCNAQFSFGPEQVLYQDREDAKEFCAADLDGDGDQDVVTTFEYDGDLLVSLNEGTGLAWQELFLSSDLSAPKGLVLGDISGDGNVDVVVAESGLDRIIWFAGQGDGSFGAVQVLNTNIIDASFLLATDLDADADVDILSLSISSGVRVHLNQGTGTFDEPAFVTAAMGATKLVLADADADADLDIFMDSAPARWLANTGDASFTMGSVIETWSLYYGWDVADIDADGDQDFVASAGGDIYYCLNDGAGAFTYNDPQSELWITYLEMIRDVDGDGDLDYIGRYSEFVPDPLVEPIAYFEMQGTSLTGYERHDIAWLDLQHLDEYRWLLADLDTDGDLDIGATQENSMGDLIAWYKQDTTIWQEIIGYGTQVIHQNEWINPFVYAIGDHDDDGFDDPLVKNRFMMLDEDLQLASDPFIIAGPPLTGPPVFTDMNMDGITDAYLSTAYVYDSISIALGVGDGTFAPGYAVRHVENEFQSQVLDADQDGDPDIFYNAHDPQFSSQVKVLCLLRNNGDGTFAEPLLIHQPAPGVSGGIQAIGDVDGDGDPDLVRSASWSDGGPPVSARVLQLDLGNNQYGPPDTLPPAFAILYQGADMDNDGRMDLITQLNGGHRWHSYTQGQWDTVGTSITDDTHHGDEMVDVDGDGDLDMLRSHGVVGVAWNNGAGHFSAIETISAPGGNSGIATSVDMDHDGIPDILMNNGNSWGVLVSWFKGALPTALPDDQTVNGPSLLVVPNPFNHTARVDLSGFTTGPLTLEVVSSTGAIVQRRGNVAPGNVLLDRSMLDAGPYLLRVRDGRGIQRTARFIVE
jgi:hypothetical protein